MLIMLMMIIIYEDDDEEVEEKTREIHRILFILVKGLQKHCIWQN